MRGSASGARWISASPPARPRFRWWPADAAAVRDYPIVFASDEGAMPLAVTPGVAAEQNLFVEADRPGAAAATFPAMSGATPSSASPPRMTGPPCWASIADKPAADDGEGGRHAVRRPPGHAHGPASRRWRCARPMPRTRPHPGLRSGAEGQAPAGAAQRAGQLCRCGRAVVQGFQLVDEAAFRALPATPWSSFTPKAGLISSCSTSPRSSAGANWWICPPRPAAGRTLRRGACRAPWRFNPPPKRFRDRRDWPDRAPARPYRDR